jgi:hypothetical protein
MQAGKWFHDKHYWLVEEEEHVWHDGSYHKPRQIEEEENAAREVRCARHLGWRGDVRAWVATGRVDATHDASTQVT